MSAAPLAWVGPRPGRFGATVAGVVLTDAVTKLVAVDQLALAYVPHPVLGDAVRWTLVYNRGAAFGMHVGAWSRVVFIVLTLVATAGLWQLWRSTPEDAQPRQWALALVLGGALGNLVDRLKSGRGVVDFIDVGVGDWRWPTFNVADIAVSTGAVLLAIVLWREESAHARAAASQAPEWVDVGTASDPRR
ncbi:MAG: signal peptidase II [Gemmatimonadaceae bacterium]|nr:signal peptidase II [Gemmatimonadaceae bacterium]